MQRNRKNKNNQCPVRWGVKNVIMMSENVRFILSRRDRMLVEIRYVHERWRAVRYAIFSLHIVSLTGHPMRLTDTFLSTNILFLSEQQAKFPNVIISKILHIFHTPPYGTSEGATESIFTNMPSLPGLSKIAFSLFWVIDAHQLRQYFCGKYFNSHLISNLK